MPFYGPYPKENPCELDLSVVSFLPGLALMKTGHCFGINAHTFLFQVGNPIVCIYSTVAILGESGCGRNRAAERIGRVQGNCKKWVRINCRLCEGSLGARPQKFHAPEACSGGF